MNKGDVDLSKIANKHIVIVLQESLGNNYPNKKAEVDLMSKLS